METEYRATYGYVYIYNTRMYMQEGCIVNMYVDLGGQNRTTA